MEAERWKASSWRIRALIAHDAVFPALLLPLDSSRLVQSKQVTEGLLLQGSCFPASKMRKDCDSFALRDSDEVFSFVPSRRWTSTLTTVGPTLLKGT
jgi:hypothetical protein